MDKADRPERIEVRLIDGFALLSFASVVEPLRAANHLAGETLYEIGVRPASGHRAFSSSGTEAPLQALSDSPDLVLVVAGGDPFAFQSADFLKDLRRQAKRGATMGGVSGGPVILARAGLLSGRRMTVHWEHAAALAELQPELLIERNLFVIDRDRVTCAGGTAPLDLMHTLIARDHGAAFAREVSDWFLHTEVRLAGDPQRAGLQERLGVANRAVLDAVEMMETHIADPLALAQIASIAGVGERQLNRLFRDRLGRSTMAFYRDLRLDAAKKLLQTSPLAVAAVAEATGFASPAHFSRAYRSRFGAEPSSARRSE